MSGFGIPGTVGGGGGGGGGGDASSANQLTQINLANSTNNLLNAGLPSSLGVGGGLKIDGSGSALPISGTITANIGSSGSLALDSSITSLSQKFSSLGQKTSINSTPVVLASDQSIIAISAVSLPLPTGAATATLQNTGINLLTSLDTKAPTLIGGRLPVDGSGVTQPISGSVTANIGSTNGLALDSSITSLNNKFATLGQKLSTGSTPVVIASDQSAIPISGNISISNFPSTQNISGTVTANIGTTNGIALDTTLLSLSAKFNSLGQKTSANSSPVVIASDQSSISVNASSLPLPTGASTSALQSSTNSLLTSIDNKITTVNTGAVVVTSSTLPTGASTSSLQTTGNNSLSSIDTKVPALVSGRVPVDGSAVVQPVSGNVAISNFPASQPVTFSGSLPAGTNQIGHVITDIGSTVAVSNFPATQPISGTVTANIGTTNGLALDTSVNNINSKLGSLGQKNSAGSAPVVIASDQSTLPISASSLPLPTGAATSALQTSGNASLTSIASSVTSLDNKSPILISGRIPVDGSGVTQPISGTITANIGTTNGLALDTTLAKLSVSQGVALGANTQTLIGGSVTTAAPTYITGNINPLSLTTAGALRVDNSGNTQPVAGTITANIGTTNGLALDSTLSSLNSKFNTLGQKTSANSTPVVISSDQSSLSVTVGNFPATQAISAISLPLPTNAATSALQTTANNSLSSIDGKIIAVNTGAVTVSSSVLPTGASTATLQTSGNASLTSIDSKTAALVSGRVPVDGSAVIQPISGTITANIGTTNGLALDSNLTSLRNQIPTTLGQKTSANSLAVVIASDQSVVSITGSVNAAAPVWNRTATGSITATSTGTIKNSAGRLRTIRILYSGGGTNYFQIHDKLTATAFSNATLVGFGYEISNTLDSLLLDFSEELVMSVGICWGISSTQGTYTAAAQNAIVFAEFI